MYLFIKYIPDDLKCILGIRYKTLIKQSDYFITKPFTVCYMKDLSENDSIIIVTWGNYYDRPRPGVQYEQRRFFLSQIKADFSKEASKGACDKVKC